VDIGAGPGSGALCAAQWLPDARLTLCDINQLALYYARINARHAGATVETVLGGIEAVEPGYDLAIANPPFMIDEKGRTYRDGGDLHGGALSVEWAEAAMRGLAPAGAFSSIRARRSSRGGMKSGRLCPRRSSGWDARSATARSTRTSMAKSSPSPLMPMWSGSRPSVR
jgi:hypothetical protein